MITVTRNADATGLATFGVPAVAAALALWDDADDLRAVVADSALPRPLKAVGGGSNLLFTAPFRGTLLRRASTPRVELRGLELHADGHAVLDDLCAMTAAAGLRGMENLSGIPGTLGGAIVQNAGAYGAETGELLVQATLMDLTDGSVFTAGADWMEFAYRSSRLKAADGRYVVLEAVLRLLPGAAPSRLDYGNLSGQLRGGDDSPAAVRAAVLAVRAAKLPDPAVTGSAGSFFRNPEVEPALVGPDMPAYHLPSGLVKVPAAWLIDRCGLKGRRIGGAAVWPQQPLVIVNADGSATAADVVALENLIVNTVMERFSIRLIPEVEHL